MPLDIVLFLITVIGFFVVGLPTIVRRVSVPAVVELEDLVDNDLSDRQSIYFAETDGRLADLGFRPARTFRPLNLQGSALIRTYLSEVDPAVINVNLLRSEATAGEDMSTSYLEIISKFADDTILTTRNSEISEVFDRLPNHIIQERRALKDPGALKKAHDHRFEELRVKGPEFLRSDEIFRRFQEHHQRWCAHQLSRGLLGPMNADGRHPVTVRTGLRGIANFLNPFADNFTLNRLLLALVFGVALPVAATLWFSQPANPVTLRLASELGLPFDRALALCLAPVFTVIGAAVGLIFASKSFIWTFVLCYLPLRLLGPAGAAPLWLSLWASALSHWLSRWRDKRAALV
jgi:hypothetical protein